ELLGGAWSLQGQWQAKRRSPAVLIARWRDVPLDQLGELARIDGLRGTIDHGRIELRVRPGEWENLWMRAQSEATDIARAPLRAETMHLDASLDRGQLRLRTTLAQQDGLIALELTTRTDADTPLNLTGKLTDWPIQRSGPAGQM